MADRTVNIEIKGNNRDAVRSFEEVSDVAGKTENRLKGIGGTLTNLGQSTAIASGTMAVGLGAVLKVAGDFEEATDRLKATTNATATEMNLLTEQAKEMGISTKFSATEAANAQVFLAQAGFNTNQVLTSLPSTLELATAGSLDLAQAADIASNVLTGFNLEASEMGRVADIMAQSARSSNTNVYQLGEAMKYVAPIAQSAGQSIESTTAIIGKLSDAGIQGSEAGTSLRGAMTALLDPSNDAAATLQELGIKTLDSSGNLRSMIDIIRDLEKAGATTTQIIKIFGTEAGTGMSALVSQGSASIAELEQKLLSANGTASEMAETMGSGLNAQMASMQSALEGLALAIADTGILQTVTSGIQLVAGIIRQFAALPSPVLKVATVLAVLLAGLSPVLLIIGQLTIAITALTPVLGVATGLFVGLNAPILLIVAALGALAGATIAVIQNWDIVSEHISNLWNNRIKPAFQNLIEGAKYAGGEMIKAFARGIWNFATFPIQAVSQVVSKVRAYLPSSPAKIGALSDIDKLDMMTPIAASIDESPVTNRIRNATNSIRNSIGNGEKSLPGTGYAGSGVITINIDFNPQIQSNGDESIIEQLRRHSRELIELIRQSQERINRGNF